MTLFIQKYTNTIIIVINIPHTHDLAKDSRVNLEIQVFNAKLGKITKSFWHVALAEIDFNRKHFTKHGFHLNNAGKEGFAKLIASQIGKLITNSKKIEPMIALKWKEETTIVSLDAADNHKPNLMSSEDEFSKILIPPVQIHNSKGDLTDNDSLCRTLNRQKKAPVTKSKDFLW
jgi:hypothetical protein